MSVAARIATVDDLDDLVHMDSQLRAGLNEQRGGAVYVLRNHRSEPVRDSLIVDIADDDTLVVVGTVGSCPVGFGVASFLRLEGGYGLVEITEIFVDPQFREVGVGGAIMSVIMDWANDRDADGIDSRAMPGDRATKNFFESNGLVARAIFVHRDLREP